MQKFVLLLALSMAQLWADVRFSSFCECDGWSHWAPRDAISPQFAILPEGGRGRNGALQITTHSAAEFGAWKITVPDLKGKRTYRFEVWYRATHAPYEKRSVSPRLEWFDAQGKSLRPAEFGLATTEEGDWRKVQVVTPSPEGTACAQVQLGFGFAADAAILWDDFVFEEEKNPPDRVVNVATVFHRPRGMKSSAESIESFCQVASRAAPEKPDLLCLPEGISVVGTGKSYYDVSEPIPGPASDRLGVLARQLHTYIVAGLYERDGPLVYNTAVLIGRDGKLVGRYRKTHLPREEWEAGITPGSEYPVFDTDFGRVGLIICWDVQFPEPARAMAVQGAEILLLPIWGGNETLAKARAIENHVFLVSSSYDMKTFILNPEGKVLAEASPDQPVALASLHLDQKIFEWWLGDMKARTWRERRPDIRVN